MNPLQTYTILEKIGKGGGGTIYKAYHNRLQQIVVLKKINDPKRSTSSNRQEVDLLKNLNHTHLPHVLDFLETEEGVFTVMNFVEGKSFQQLLNEGRTFTSEELVKWTKQLCSALDYLHSQRIPIIHGDIKPSNIMLQPDGNICLIDFNISFMLDKSAALGYSKGYTSPEQFWAVSSKTTGSITQAQYAINQKSDIYSVGATLYHLATGNKRADYEHDIDFDRLADIMGVPFAEVIAKATNLDASKRYQSAAEMLKAVEEIPRKDERYKRLVRGQYLKSGGFALAAVICLFIAVLGFGSMQNDKNDSYYGLVDQQKSCIEQGNYGEAESLAAQAAEVQPKTIDAKYWQAFSLYQQGRYEESNAYLDKEIINGPSKKSGKSSSVSLKDAYVLEGRNSIALGDGGSAVAAFQAAEEAGDLSGSDYRDYAVAMAYANQYDGAEQMLAKAEEQGADKAGTAFTRGEIDFTKGNMDSALSQFDFCISNTKDNYMKMRAYLMESKIYEQQGNMDQCRAVLNSALSKLPEQNHYAILERLAQADISMKYYSEAADCLNKIIDKNWASWTDYDTLAYVYYQQSEFSAMETPLHAMEGIDSKDNYRISMWRALAAMKAGNYSTAEQYYQQADQGYQSAGRPEDSQMEVLYSAYQDMKGKGW